MANSKFLIALFLVFGCSTLNKKASAPEQAPLTPPRYTTGQRIGSDPEEIGSYEMSYKGQNYLISFTNAVTIYIREKNQEWQSLLHIETEYFETHAVEYLFDGHTLYLLAEIGSGDEGTSLVTKIDMTTWKLVWKLPLAGFNAGPAMFTGESLYVTTGSVVGKVNLKTGKYEWIYTGFDSEVVGCDMFTKMRREKDNIQFICADVRPGQKDPLVIMVNDKTGAVVSHPNLRRLNGDGDWGEPE